MALVPAPRRPERASEPGAGTAGGQTASDRGRLRSGSSAADAGADSTAAHGAPDVLRMAPTPRAPSTARRRHIRTGRGLFAQLRGNVALLRAMSTRKRPDVLHLDIPGATTVSVLGSGVAARAADLFGVPAVLCGPTEALVAWFDKAPAPTAALARVSLTVDSARWVVTDPTQRADLAERLLLSPAHLRDDSADQACADVAAPTRRWQD